MQIDRAKHSQCNQQQPFSALVQDKPRFGAIAAARIRHSSLVTYSEDQIWNSLSGHNEMIW